MKCTLTNHCALMCRRHYYTGRSIKNQQKYAKTNTVIYKCMEK